MLSVETMFVVNRLKVMKVLSTCKQFVHMYNVWSYNMHVSHMQTNAEYDTTVTRMCVITYTMRKIINLYVKIVDD